MCILIYELELRSAEREHTKIDWRSDPNGAMGSNGTMKLVSIGLLLLIAYCNAIVRQAMQTSVPSRHSQCVALYTQKSDCLKDNRFCADKGTRTPTPLGIRS